jgi:hypothetical protein
VVENALSAKLPKLVRAEADRRLLLLERDEFTLPEEAINNEIERRRSSFPELNKVHEIWFAETVFFESQGHVEFSLLKPHLKEHCIP